ncbi:MAG: DUF4832 domain-containing protein [Paludibacteraceae bacterium]|nr:DUF4832 domain-containing protein [Paludibacteraceae bacterium]
MKTLYSAFIACMAISVMVFSSCKKDEPQAQVSQSSTEQNGGSNKGEAENPSFGQAVKGKRTIDQVQPMTGLVLWNDLSAGRNSTYGKCFALEFTYCLPCDVVKGKDAHGNIIYDWTSLENTLNGVKSRNHQSILRFRYEYPNANTNGVKGGTAVPKYIKDMDGYNETYTANPGGDGPTYYADWSNNELQWFTKQFYTDFAAKYDGDPRIAVLEVGFGHWSEYHIYGTRLQLGKNFPSKAYQTEFLKHIDNTFKVLPWAISIDAADDSYTPIVDNASLMALGFGLFDDSFMHEGHEIGSGDGYNERNWKAIGKDTRWQKGPCGGEISYYTNADQRNFLNPAGMYGITWEQAVSKYHISFMISNDALGGSYATPDRFKEGSMTCGYQFRLTFCRTDGEKTQVTFTNEGVAPIYKDAYPAIGNVRAEVSLKGLLPGEKCTCTIPAKLSKIEDLQIVCDYILPTQQIQFNANL